MTKRKQTTANYDGLFMRIFTRILCLMPIMMMFAYNLPAAINSKDVNLYNKAEFNKATAIYKTKKVTSPRELFVKMYVQEYATTFYKKGDKF